MAEPCPGAREVGAASVYVVAVTRELNPKASEALRGKGPAGRRADLERLSGVPARFLRGTAMYIRETGATLTEAVPPSAQRPCRAEAPPMPPMGDIRQRFLQWVWRGVIL